MQIIAIPKAKKPTGFVFRCTDKTQKECFDRMLFGETDNPIHRKMVEQIKIGDLIFLYNNNSRQMYGAFEATSLGKLNIEPNAWAGKFPLQVQVKWKHKFIEPLPRDISEMTVGFWGADHRHPREYLYGNQAKALLELFKAHEPPSPAEVEFRNAFPARFFTADGHRVRSFGEVLIDNWLFHNGIVHGYEMKVPIQEQMYCDFYIPAPTGEGFVYIEYWGMKEKRYLDRKIQKRALYAKYDLPLIELERGDLDYIDDAISSKLFIHLKNLKIL